MSTESVMAKILRERKEEEELQEMYDRRQEEIESKKSGGQMGGPSPMAMGAMSGGEGGAMGGMGPWAALAAAVIGNETYQQEQGNRPEDAGEHYKEMLSGEVLERDAEKYLSDVPGAEFHAEMGNPEGAWKNIKKTLKPWELFT